MKKLLAITLLMFLLSACLHREGKLPQIHKSAELMQLIEQMGEEKSISTLWNNQKEFDRLLRPVENGETEWFKPWLKLRPYADAGFAESIDSAFSRALPIATVAILRLIGHGLELQNICGSPFIEPEPGVAEKYEKETLAALARVSDASIGQVAKECSVRVKLKN